MEAQEHQHLQHITTTQAQQSSIPLGLSALRHHFDAVVIGGGIFGCYAALFLAKTGRRVCLLEQESALLQKASLVNQARLHGGYHYPRSMGTAMVSDEHKERFTQEHRAFVHSQFEKYYAIDRYGSFTDALQFERFCERLRIRCERVTDHPLFNYDRLEALYRTEEHSFDPVLLQRFYTQSVLGTPGITVRLQTALVKGQAVGSEWEMEAAGPQEERITLAAPLVINATYCATNAVHEAFGLQHLQLTHEISEIGFITSPQFGDRGLTVMDGPFGSIMPYGKSGLLSLSSVAYTHHKISYEALPSFDCQTGHAHYCSPQSTGLCTPCAHRPPSNSHKMLRQMQQYFSDKVHFDYWFSYFTIKSKLKASHIDDGRPTEISLLHSSPDFYSLFAGKINSIYEIEKMVR